MIKDHNGNIISNVPSNRFDRARDLGNSLEAGSTFDLSDVGNHDDLGEVQYLLRCRALLVVKTAPESYQVLTKAQYTMG